MSNIDVDLDKDVFTTFDVAKICNANITSIKNWIEKGELQAHRTPGGHYRIKKKVLQDFLNRHGMPNPFVERRRKHILAFHGDGEIEEKLRTRFGEIHRYAWTADPTAALLKIGQWRPDVAIVDDGLDGIEGPKLLEAVESNLDLRPVRLIFCHGRGPEYSGQLREAGAEYVVEAEEGEDGIFEAVRRALL